ncbi:hypothetical protein [Pseudomonas luteola]
MTIKARNRWIHSSIFSVLAAFSFHAMADTNGLFLQPVSLAAMISTS